MSLLKLFGDPSEGIIEIEENYLQLMYPREKKWKQKRIEITEGRDQFETLRRVLKDDFKGIRQFSLILHLNSGSKILPFPEKLNEKEILNHIDLKKEEYFGTKADSRIALRRLSSGEGGSRDYLVSHVNRSYVEKLQAIANQTGHTLVRVVTVIEALIGSYLQQLSSTKTADQVCLLSLGYSDVNMVVARGSEIIGVRTAITGSLKELEDRLLRTLKLGLDEVKTYFTGEVKNPDPNSLEIIRQNQRELLARITPFFAFIRSRKKIAGNQTILLAMPYLKLAGMKELLEQTFSGEVYPLNSGYKEEISQDSDLEWFLGATSKKTTSLLPPRPPFFRFALSPRVAWMFIMFFLLIPLAFIKINAKILEQKIDYLSRKNSQSKPFFDQIKINSDRMNSLFQISNVVRGELSQQKFVSAAIALISAQKPEALRFEKIMVSPANNTLLIKGYSFETEAVLAFWNRLQKIPILQDVKVHFPQGKNADAMEFSITAVLGG